jgi:hypothetical protein
MSDLNLSEGVTIEEVSGPVYENFVKNQKSFSEIVRFQPYNQVLSGVSQNDVTFIFPYVDLMIFSIF